MRVGRGHIRSVFDGETRGAEGLGGTERGLKGVFFGNGLARWRFWADFGRTSPPALGRKE